MSLHVKLAFTHRRRFVMPILFGISVALWSIGFPWIVKTIFFVYSAFVHWTLSSAQSTGSLVLPRHSPNKLARHNSRWMPYTAIFALCFLLTTRLIPFLRFGEAPLGYDTGFYVGTIQTLLAPPSINNAALYLALTPFLATGLPPSFLLHFFHVIFQVLIAGSMYFLLSSLAVSIRNRLATYAIALFSFSVIQFSGFWEMFTQQTLAMGLFLIAVALFIRGSLWTVFFALITLLVHISTGIALLLTFAVFYFIYGIRILFLKKNHRVPHAKTIFVAGILITPVALLLKGADIVNLFSNVVGVHGIFLNNIPLLQMNEFRGFFPNADSLRMVTLGFFPLSIFTILYPNTWARRQIDGLFFYQQLLILYSALLVLLILTFSPIIYQARSSIILDLLLLVFAAPAFLLFVEFFSHDRTGKLLVALLFTHFLLGIGLRVWQQPSMISPQEFQNIKKIPSLIGSGAGILATDSLYAPWLWGFVGPNTVSPGYLGDSWDYSTWVKFWSETSDDERLRLLGSRDHPQPPMLIYIGDRQPRGRPFERFIRTSSSFAQITNNLWKFTADPRAQSVPPSPSPTTGTIAQ